MELLIALPLIAIIALTIWHYELQVRRLTSEKDMEIFGSNLYEIFESNIYRNADHLLIDTYAKKAKDLAEKNADLRRYNAELFQTLIKLNEEKRNLVLKGKCPVCGSKSKKIKVK